MVTFKMTETNTQIKHEQPVSSPYDHTVEECESTVEKWKELIYKEVKAYDTSQVPE